MMIDLPFEFGQVVYHALCPDDRGMVTGYTVRNGFVIVLVTWGNRNETSHYPYELTTEPDYAQCSPAHLN